MARPTKDFNLQTKKCTNKQASCLTLECAYLVHTHVSVELCCLPHTQLVHMTCTCTCSRRVCFLIWVSTFGKGTCELCLENSVILYIHVHTYTLSVYNTIVHREGNGKSVHRTVDCLWPYILYFSQSYTLLLCTQLPYY